MDSIELLKKLVSFNTICDNDNEGMVNYIEKYLNELGFKTEKIQDENGNNCIFASIGKNPQIAFMGHMDVVDIGSGWDTNPFELTCNEGKLFGRGTCDMKGGIAAILYALSQLDLKNINNGIQLIFTTDEETTFKGINAVISSGKKIAPYAILCEPTDLFPVIATKGVLSYKLTFFGKASHSSNPYQGKNAIMDAVSFINEVKSFADKLKEETDDSYKINHTTFNVGVINGGTKTNVVPDRCTLKLEFRIISEKQRISISKNLNEFAKKYDCEVEQKFEINPMIVKNEEFIRNIEKISKHRMGLNYLTEASFITGADVIILGPGPITAHESNEYITCESYVETIRIYSRIIEEYCYKKFENPLWFHAKYELIELGIKISSFLL